MYAGSLPYTHKPTYSGGHPFCHFHHPPVHLDYPVTHQEVYDCEPSLAGGYQAVPNGQQYPIGMYSHRLSNFTANNSSKDYNEHESLSPHIDKSSCAADNAALTGHLNIPNTKHFSRLPRGSQPRSRNMTKTFPGGLSERQPANQSTLLTSNLHPPSLSTNTTGYSNTVYKTSSKVDRDGLNDHGCNSNSQPIASYQSPKIKKAQETLYSKSPQIVAYRSIHRNRSGSLQQQARLIHDGYTDTDSNTTTRCISSEQFYVSSSEGTRSSAYILSSSNCISTGPTRSNGHTSKQCAQSDPENGSNVKNHDNIISGGCRSSSFDLVHTTHDQPITSDEDSERSSEDDGNYHSEQIPGNNSLVEECVEKIEHSVVKVDAGSQTFNNVSGPTSKTNVPHSVRFSSKGHLNRPNLVKQGRVRSPSEPQATTLRSKYKKVPENKRSKTFPLNVPGQLPTGVKTGSKESLTVKEAKSRQVFKHRGAIKKPEKFTKPAYGIPKSTKPVPSSTKPAYGNPNSTKPVPSSTKPVYGNPNSTKPVPSSTKPAYGNTVGNNMFAAADPLPPITISEQQDNVPLKNKTEREENIEPRNRPSTAESECYAVNNSVLCK